MKRKKTPIDSNKFPKNRSRSAAINYRNSEPLIDMELGQIRTEGVSFFNLLSKIKTLKEDAQVKSYPPQALGRKRNMFLDTLTLDDTKFTEWVHNRLYRIAFDNKRSVSDFTPKDIEIGLGKWEEALRNGDPGFGKYQSQFSAYKERFIKASTSILTNSPSGKGTTGVAPHEAPALSPSETPVTPTALKLQGGMGSARAAPTANSIGSPQAPSGQQNAPQESALPPESQEEEVVSKMIDDMYQAVSMKDKDFTNLVQNKLLNNDVDHLTTNEIELERSLDNDFQNLLDAIPPESHINDSRNEIEEIYSQYKERFLLAAGKITTKTVKNTDRASEKESRQAKLAGTSRAKDYQAALAIGIASLTGQDLSSIGIDDNHIKLMRKNPELYSAGRRMANTLLTNYPNLSKTTVVLLGGSTDIDEQHIDWLGTDTTPKTDILLDLDGKRLNFKNDKFVSCGSKDKNENCSSKIKISMKLGDSELSTNKNKEAISTFNTVLTNLSNKDYDIADPIKLSHRLMADGIEPLQAKEISQTITSRSQMFAEKLDTLVTAATQGQSDDKIKLSESINQLSKEVALFIAEIVPMLPSLIEEFIYVSMTGCGKFKEGSDSEANFVLASDHAGDKVILLPANRDLAKRIAESVQIQIQTKSANVKSKTDPLMVKYRDAGLSAEEAQYKISTENPYTAWQLLEIINTAKEQQATLDPYITAQVLQNSVMLNFVKNMRILKEQDEFMDQEPIDMLSPDDRDYVTTAVSYAFSTFQNTINFFGIDFIGISGTNYNLYNIFALQEPTDLKSQINNRVDMNTQIGDELQQGRTQNESKTYLNFRNKMKEYII